jgi:glutamate synthase (NADPH/NADH) small chain
VSIAKRTPGITAGRLSQEVYDENFADLHPPLTAHAAMVAADRCYFCYDAPCVTACPTEIDIPLFIRQIATGQPKGAAQTIFDQNILGGMCARVCPTETLCEQACVREMAEGKPVLIGRLQRFATDTMMQTEPHPYSRAPDTGKRVAVVGAGPAGLACAHRLAMHGHAVTLYDPKPKLGGLNEYGIAAYKTVDDFAQAEVDWLLSIGGIAVESGKALGADLTLNALAEEFDAVFLSTGLAGVNALALEGAATEGVQDAVAFIADLRQASDLEQLPIGRNVVVIGGGMTAIDAGVQAKLLGAEDVTIVYRRGRDRMNASELEQDLATSKGVRIKHWAQPASVQAGANGRVAAIEFEYTEEGPEGFRGTGDQFTLEADQILVAIGQTLDGSALDSVALQAGRIVVDEQGRTSRTGVWAGGDCTGVGEDLTVAAVAQGRDAAMSIHKTLAQQ